MHVSMEAVSIIEGVKLVRSEGQEMKRGMVGES